MLPNAAELVQVGSGLAQTGHLPRSPRASAAEGKQPLYVLSRSNEQGFGVHLLQSPQPEPPGLMPILGFAKQGLYPHLGFLNASR
jgi:hypothetical protein